MKTIILLGLFIVNVLTLGYVFVQAPTTKYNSNRTYDIMLEQFNELEPSQSYKNNKEGVKLFIEAFKKEVDGAVNFTNRSELAQLFLTLFNTFAFFVFFILSLVKQKQKS